MSEAEFLTQLAQRFELVGSPRNAENSEAGRAIREAEGVHWKAVSVYERRDNKLIRREIFYYVIAETGEAFYHQKEPESLIPVLASSPVREALKTLLQGDGTLLAGKWLEIDEAAGLGKAEVYQQHPTISAQVVKKNLVAFKRSGSIVFRELA